MLTKKRLPQLIVFICSIEISIYLWAIWTATLDKSNFFSIESEYIFDKCARNSGRISAFIILITLMMVGYYGLKEIYRDGKKKDTFRILITLFSFNHIIHFMFLFLRFKNHAAPLSLVENLHGFLTFISIIIIPFILWTKTSLTMLLHFGIILYLFNISYFINKTFLGKVKADHPAYHNLFGIVLITAACLYVLFRVFMENNRNSNGDSVN